MKQKYASKSDFISGEKYYTPKLKKTYDVRQCSTFANCKTNYEENQLKTNRSRYWKALKSGRDLNTDIERDVLLNEYYSRKSDYLQFSVKACNNIIDRDRQIHDRTISHEDKLRYLTQKHKIVKKDCVGDDFTIASNEFIRGNKYI